jgi:hypothetical protein
MKTLLFYRESAFVSIDNDGIFGSSSKILLTERVNESPAFSCKLAAIGGSFSSFGAVQIFSGDDKASDNITTDVFASVVCNSHYHVSDGRADHSDLILGLNITSRVILAVNRTASFLRYTKLGTYNLARRSALVDDLC